MWRLSSPCVPNQQMETDTPTLRSAEISPATTNRSRPRMSMEAFRAASYRNIWKGDQGDAWSSGEPSTIATPEGG
jgi:hypothetical protein